MKQQAISEVELLLQSLEERGAAKGAAVRTIKKKKKTQGFEIKQQAQNEARRFHFRELYTLEERNGRRGCCLHQ